jgi:hypothetical protein
MTLSALAARRLEGGMASGPAGREVAAALVHQTQVDVQDLAADGDQAALATWFSAGKVTLISVGLALVGSSAGIDGSNTVAVTVANGANTIVTKTYGATPPTNNAVNDLGALSATYKEVAAGGVVNLAITQGATANLPPCKLVIRYIPRA